MENQIRRKKERQSNLELYRIIVMLLIVAHHYVVNSGLWPVMQDNPDSLNSIFLYWFGMWGKTGINCFVLITGYFMCKSEASIYKFFKLLLEVFFYNVVFYLIFVLTGKITFHPLDCFHALLPIKNIGDGFVSAFIFFYLFIPFLNMFIRQLDKRQHLHLIALCLLIYTLWDMMPTIKVYYNYISWFIILYLIASYIRLYPHAKRDKDGRFWAKVTGVCVIIAMASVYFRKGGEAPYRLVSDTNAILALVISVSSFMLFKNLRIRQNRLINTVAASTFGVLLIHANSDTMRRWLWGDTLGNVDHYTDPYCWMHAIISVVAVFSVCICIDYLRIRLIERPFFSSRFYTRLEQTTRQLIK